MSGFCRLLLTLAIAGTLSGLAHADPGSPIRLFRWRSARTYQAKPQPLPAVAGQPPATVDGHAQYRYNPYDRESLNEYYRQLYPKYYWGFHARTLQNYGYAPGDIGFRGGPGYPGQAW